MFTVKVDLDRGLFETVIEGFWTLNEVAAFGQAIEAAGHRIAATGRAPVSLCDYTGAAIQSQQVINALEALMERPAVRSRRVAMHVATTMPKLQASRATRNRDEFRFFTDRAEAERWLFAE